MDDRVPHGQHLDGLKRRSFMMDDETFERITMRGFHFAMFLIAAVIAIRVLHYALTTNAPWV